MDNKKLPQMTVEKRVSTTAHGVPKPDTSKQNLNKELQLAIQLNQDVWKSDWEFTTLEILEDYSEFPVTHTELIESVRDVMGHTSWKDCVEFVQNDMCLEFFNSALKYCLSEGQAHVKSKGFIDGSGIGYVKEYTKDLKVSLEKAFDVKYYYKVQRPLEWALSQGIDLTRVANKIHPGHYSLKAGHATKFNQAVETLNRIFYLDTKCYRKLKVAAYVESMARSGNLIHYPMDNVGVDILLVKKTK